MTPSRMSAFEEALLLYFCDKDIIKKSLNEIAEHLIDEDFSKSLDF